jgi:hypothetical protein
MIRVLKVEVKTGLKPSIAKQYGGAFVHVLTIGLDMDGLRAALDTLLENQGMVLVEYHEYHEFETKEEAKQKLSDYLACLVDAADEGDGMAVGVDHWPWDEIDDTVH